MDSGMRIRCMARVTQLLYSKGTLYYASGKPAYQGQWVDDKFEGEGVLYNEYP